MPKPTLLQSLLNKPSQSYQPTSSSLPRRSFSLHHNFHSVKDDMNRAALECLPVPQAFPAPVQAPLHPPDIIEPDRAVADDQDGSDNSNGDSDVFYTPNTSPRSTLYEEQPSLDDALSNIAEKLSPAALDVPKDTRRRSQLPALSRSRSLPRSVASSSSTSSTNAISSGTSLFSHPSSSTVPTSRATTPLSFGSDRHSSLSSLPAPIAETDTSSLSGSTRSSGRKRSTKIASDDWAKEVRWLVPAIEPRKPASSHPKRSSGASVHKPAPTGSASMIQTLTPMPVHAVRSTGTARRSKTIGSHPKPPTLDRRRMSAVWEEDENDELNQKFAPNRTSLDTAFTNSHPHSRSTSRSNSLKRATTTKSGTSSVRSGQRKDPSLTASTSTAFSSISSRTVDIPSPLPVTDGGTPSGFTSLVLPRAAYVPSSSKRYSVIFGSGDTVDITRSGLAQTTMTTISITKNAALSAAQTRPRFLSLTSFTNSVGGLASRSSKDLIASAPEHILLSLPLPLSITSHTPPPSKVQSTQVLVQVYAVALDGLDDVIVHDKAARQDSYGFVPGRSFVGRAVECGYEVNSIGKSDWVMGLLDMRKCGGLAEFIVVDKRRLTRCPQPSQSSTLEQLAILPLCGIPAHRAVRTTDLVGRGTRALVLQGHEGAGALAVQELVGSGAHVTVQVPPNIHKETEKNAVELRNVIERLKNWGASEVKVEKPVAAIESLNENEFDLVIDTVGGRRIWDACRRILQSSGQFTTLVGDSSETIPSANTQFRSNLRSLRRAFVKKDHKAIGYSWVSPIADVDTDGEDIRDSLLAIAKLAGEGTITPYVEPSRCVPFERAPAVFKREKGMLSCGRTAVVRIID